MDNKPIFYDGSLNTGNQIEEQLESAKPIEVTDEARKSIGINPYSFEN